MYTLKRNAQGLRAEGEAVCELKVVFLPAIAECWPVQRWALQRQISIDHHKQLGNHDFHRDVGAVRTVDRTRYSELARLWSTKSTLLGGTYTPLSR